MMLLLSRLALSAVVWGGLLALAARLGRWFDVRQAEHEAELWPDDLQELRRRHLAQMRASRTQRAKARLN